MEQRQQGHFSGTGKDKHQNTKPKKTEVCKQNKTEVMKQKEIIKKASNIQLSKYVCNIFTSLYCHKFVTHINMRYIRCHVPTI